MFRNLVHTGVSSRFDKWNNSSVFELKPHHDLAEVLVGFHMRERLADVVKGKHLVDRQLQFARLHRRPDILSNLLENLADFIDRAGPEGDADIADAARGMQIEIEIGMRAAEPADIDDAAFDFGGLQVLARDWA